MSLFIADLFTLAPCAAVRMTGKMGQYRRSAVFSIQYLLIYIHYLQCLHYLHTSIPLSRPIVSLTSSR